MVHRSGARFFSSARAFPSLSAQPKSAALGALATLGFGIGSKYQVYYPEDIKTYGASIATGLGSWATNFEVAYRPDFPFQISVQVQLSYSLGPLPAIIAALVSPVILF